MSKLLNILARLGLSKRDALDIEKEISGNNANNNDNDNIIDKGLTIICKVPPGLDAEYVLTKNIYFNFKFYGHNTLYLQFRSDLGTDVEAMLSYTYDQSTGDIYNSTLFKIIRYLNKSLEHTEEMIFQSGITYRCSLHDVITTYRYISDDIIEIKQGEIILNIYNRDEK